MSNQDAEENHQQKEGRIVSPSEYTRHKYHTLDGIRGIAAIVVVLAHTSVWFDGYSFPEGYLAVDLFFVLSGFVIAEAYSEKIRIGVMSVKSFMTVRVIRLYPLYILGMLLGAVVKFGKYFAGMQDELISAQGLIGTIAFSIFMLPSPFVAALYPLNGPSWSLFFELVANAVYAICHRFLSITLVFWALSIFALLLILCVLQIGHLNVGFSWGAAYVGFPRVFFSFLAGLLVHRFRNKLSISIPSYLIFLFVLVVFVLEPSELVRPYYDLIVVLFVFPLVVILGANNNPVSGVQERIYTVLGETSYTLYVLHVPASWLLRGVVLYLTGKDVSAYSPVSGLVLIPVLMVLAWVTGRIYDQPVRVRLSTSFQAKLISAV